MKTRKVDNKIEREIVTGMIISTQFLKDVRAIYTDDLMAVPYARTVARWCLDYGERYGEAPSRHIGDIFDSHRRNGLDAEHAELIADFLAGLSDDYEHAEAGKFNSAYLLDQTEARFEARNQELLMQDVKALHARSDFKAAEDLLRNYKRVARPTADGCEPLDDMAGWQRAFDDDDSRVLFHLPGALGELVGPVEREDFIGILGPEKRGKCLAGDSEVLLPSGEVMRMDEAVKKQTLYVVSLNEDTMRLERLPVQQHWVNGKKPCIRLTTRTGRQVTVTKNHPMLTPDGWVEAGKLAIGDRLATPRSLPFFGTTRYKDTRVKLLAFMLADGGMTGNHCPSFTKKDVETQDDFKKCVAEIGDKVTAVSSYEFYVVNRDGLRGKHGSNKTVAWLRELGLMRKGAAEKFIPPFVFTMAKDKLALFLRTLITCDGCCSRTEISYSSASETTLRQAHHLLLRFGIVSAMKSRIVGGKTYWGLVIRDKENMLAYLRQIGFAYNKAALAASLEEELSKQTRSNSFIDSVPAQISKRILQELKGRVPAEFKEALRTADKNDANLSRPLVRKMAAFSAEADKAANGDVLWDYLVSIEDAGIQETYDLGVLKNHNFVANDFVVHNTWRLLDIAVRALREGCNVAYFDAGDMSADQWKRRLGTRITGQSHKYWGRSLRPVIDCAHSQSDRCRRRERISRRGCTEERVDDNGRTAYKRLAFKDVLGYAPCTACAKDTRPDEFMFKGAVWYEEVDVERLDWRQAYEVGKRMAERSRKRLKLSCHPNSTLTVAGMRAQLDRWRDDDGFVADVVVADYFDIFDEEPGVRKADSQARLVHDVRWRAGRRLTQELHCALITATQADAPSYDQKSLKLKNFSESKTKYAHATKFLSLNQTPEEKRDGIMRMATLIAREDDFDIAREVAIGQDLRHGQPYLFSYWDHR